MSYSCEFLEKGLATKMVMNSSSIEFSGLCLMDSIRAKRWRNEKEPAMIDTWLLFVNLFAIFGAKEMWAECNALWTTEVDYI